MNAAARAIAAGGLKRRALSLGAVKAFDHAMQFLLPVLLVRCLDAATFGEYRLLWLTVGTLMAVATLNMAGSLYYFLPRSEPSVKRLYIHQTLAFLGFAGLACAFLVSPWNPVLPEAVQPLAKYGPLVPAFVALWVTAVLLDYLPTIDERIAWQARVTVVVTVARVVLVAAAAWFGASLEPILWMLVATVLFKLGVLLYYIQRHHGLGRPWFQAATFAGQVRYAVPFGVSSAFYSLRSQADQWVAAALFALHSFAAFSIAAILGQVVNVFRNSVLEAFLPSMSRFEAAGDVRAMMDMNARGNVMVATALFPLLGLVSVFAEEIVAVVYTASYLEAAPVMRVYIPALALLVIEVGSLILLLRQGPFALKVNAVALVLSVCLSLGLALAFGLPGAAAGSVVALFIDRALTLRRISTLTGVPVAELQHWGALARLGAYTAAGATLAWGVVTLWLDHAAPLVRLAAGAVVIAAIYALGGVRRRKA